MADKFKHKKIITIDGQEAMLVDTRDYVSDLKFNKQEEKDLDEHCNNGSWKVDSLETPLQHHQWNVGRLFNEVTKHLPEGYLILPVRTGHSFWIQDHVTKLESLFVRYEVNDMTTNESIFSGVARGLELQSKALKRSKKLKPRTRRWISTAGGLSVQFVDGGYIDVGVNSFHDAVPCLVMCSEYIFSRTATLGAGGGDLEKGAAVLDYIHEQFRKEGEQYLEKEDRSNND